MGQTLAAKLAAGRPSIEEIIYIGIGICFELGYAHKQGIIHGDITAENILVAADTDVRLLNVRSDAGGDVQGDIRAVGAVLRQMLAGRRLPEELDALARAAMLSRNGQYYVSADQLQNSFQHIHYELNRNPHWFRNRILSWSAALVLSMLLYSWLYNRTHGH